jgi:cation/acetate symporter
MLAEISVQVYTYIFVGLTFSLYLIIAWISRVRDTKGFYVAGQGVPALANGMATAADWMSAASFLGMAGLISFKGYVGAQYLMGWTGGYVLLALLLAPYLRKFGHFTVPDFVGDRFDSNIARLVAVVCAIFVSFTYVAGQMRGVAIVFSGFLKVDITVGVIIGMGIVFIYATLGGMKGITWTQVAQYWVLITAFLVPVIAISIKLTGEPIPQIGMGSQLLGEDVHLLDRLSQINEELGFANYTAAFGWDHQLLNMFCVTLALMAGTAGLPHVIVRFYTVKNVRAARWSAFWALLFISLLYLAAPATAAFSRYYMIDSIQGKTRAELPKWFNHWEQTGLILWFDDGDGRLRYSNREDNEVFQSGSGSNVTLTEDYEFDGKLAKQNETVSIKAIHLDHQKWIDKAGGRDWRPVLTQQKLSGPDKDIMVLATPEMAELSNWIIAFVAAGALAAALSTASGLLLVISSSVAHDVYARMINPQASEAKRLLVGRTVIGLAVVVAGYFGIYPPGYVSQVVAFAFGLAASSFFPIIVLGIFSKRVGTIPAIAGMIAGIGFTGSYIIGSVYMDMPNWCFDIEPTGIGTIGMFLNFTVTLALTPLCPPPSQKIQDMVESIREPEGAGEAVVIEEAPEH